MEICSPAGPVVSAEATVEQEPRARIGHRLTVVVSGSVRRMMLEIEMLGRAEGGGCEGRGSRVWD